MNLLTWLLTLSAYLLPTANAMFTANTVPDLTSTERRVLFLVSQDYSCKDIAVRLNICLETARKHRKNVARKLGASGKTAFRQAVRQLEQNGYIPPAQ